MREELIRDTLVVGIGDAGLSERLQLDSDLTLQKAFTSIRQSETVHQQQSLLREEEARQFPIDAVETSNVKKTKSGKGNGQPRQKTCPR